MILVYSLIFSFFILFSLLSKIRTGTFFNPLFIYITWWCGWLFISTLGLNGIYLPSENTYLVLLLSVFMTSIGAITFLNQADRKQYEIFNNINFKSKYFLYFQFILTIILLFYLNRGIGLLQHTNVVDYRGNVFTNSGVFGSLQYYIRNYFYAILLINMLITISGVYLKQIKKRTLILSSLNIVIYMGITLGRFPVVFLALSLTFGFIYLKNIMNFKINFKVYTIVIILLLIISAMSIFRKSDYNTESGVEIVSDFVVRYFTGSFVAFDRFLNTHKIGVDFDYQVCRATFAGIDEPIVMALKKIGKKVPNTRLAIGKYANTFFNIGNNQSYNAFYTMNLYFYWDGGLIGIVIYAYLFGVSLALAFNNFINRINIINLSILLLLTYFSVIGTLRWEFMNPWAWITLFGLILLLKKFTLKFDRRILTKKYFPVNQ